MGDAMPQRLTFPAIIEGPLSVKKEDALLFDFNLEEPVDIAPLWLPFDTSKLMQDLLLMCSELLLAGYPGCSGCGYRDEEQAWDVIAHRKRISNLSEYIQITYVNCLISSLASLQVLSTNALKT